MHPVRSHCRDRLHAARGTSQLHSDSSSARPSQCTRGITSTSAGTVARYRCHRDHPTAARLVAEVRTVPGGATPDTATATLRTSKLRRFAQRRQRPGTQAKADQAPPSHHNKRQKTTRPTFEARRAGCVVTIRAHTRTGPGKDGSGPRKSRTVGATKPVVLRCDF